MTTIKLNNYYPHLTECITLEVSEEIAVTLSIGGRQCDSYKRRQREHDECSLFDTGREGTDRNGGAGSGSGPLDTVSRSTAWIEKRPHSARLHGRTGATEYYNFRSCG